MTVPAPDDLPTLAQLNRATALAAGVAAAILIVAVLPAEYGLDPTGIGGALGLRAMGLTKAAASGEGEPVAAPGAGAVAASGPVTRMLPDGATQILLTLRPFEGREAKAVMAKGQAIDWRWQTDGAKVEYEMHGDPKGATDTGEYSSYEKGDAAGGSGRFTAGFDGRHGWYWKNEGVKPVTITATVKGGFERFSVLE